MARTLRLLVTFLTTTIVACISSAAATEASPFVTIESPSSGMMLTSEDIRVAVETENYRIECAGAGQPGIPGVGHIHAMLDGEDLSHLTAVECATRFTISGEGIKPGRHTLSVVLAADDHTTASRPARVSFSYLPEHAEPLPNPNPSGRPMVSIESPKNGTAVDPVFDLRLVFKDFNPSCALEGKANVPGYGHIHVIVTQAGVTDLPTRSGRRPSAMKPMIGLIGMPCATTVPIDLSAWHSGPARIAVVLVGDDHAPLHANIARINVVIR